jgi:hypothetical protein
MNEQVMKALTDMLTLSAEALKSGAQMAQQELPIVVKEYLAWGMAEAITWATIGMIIVLLCALIGWKSRKHFVAKNATSSSGHYYDGDIVACWFAQSGVSLIGIVMVIVNGRTIIQIAVAPRVYLIEQISAMVK